MIDMLSVFIYNFRYGRGSRISSAKKSVKVSSSGLGLDAENGKTHTSIVYTVQVITKPALICSLLQYFVGFCYPCRWHTDELKDG